MTAESPLRLERPFFDQRLAVCISRDADSFPFAEFAAQLAKRFDGEIIERVGPLVGFDEVYWDLRLNGEVFTLHWQHFLGVFLCATDEHSERALPNLIPFAEEFLRARSSPLGRLRALWRRLLTGHERRGT